MLKRGGLLLVAVLVILQFFQIDKSEKAADPSMDFIGIEKPEEKVKAILKNTCYDCHSNKTDYPWYSYVQPVGWWLEHHVEEGSEHLNFAEWGTYELKRKKHKIKEIVEEVDEGEMPLDSYTWIHSEARLTDEQRNRLITWFKALDVK